AAALALVAAAFAVSARAALECMITTAAALRVLDRSVAPPRLARRRARDTALLLRVAREVRPFWPHLAAMVGLSLLATPLALLAPLPLKIAVDNAIGGAPLPAVIRWLLPVSLAAEPGAALGCAVALVVLQGLLVYLHSLAVWLLQTSVGERM